MFILKSYAEQSVSHLHLQSVLSRQPGGRESENGARLSSATNHRRIPDNLLARIFPEFYGEFGGASERGVAFFRGGKSQLGGEIVFKVVF